MDELFETLEDWLPEGYDARTGQNEFIKEASEALRKKDCFLVSAPCGVGKSLAALLAVLPLLEGQKLMICYRTRSQLHIYLKEFKALNKKFKAVSFISKRDMCPRASSKISYYDFLEECRRLRKNCTSRTEPYCKFFLNNQRKAKEAEILALKCSSELLPPESAVKQMARKGFCAYEAFKETLEKVDIFLGTYHYAFDPSIRGNLLRSFNTDLSKIYLIVDEAHNLPTFARELLSDRLTQRTISSAVEESERFASDSTPLVTTYLETLNEVYEGILEDFRIDELRPYKPLLLDNVFLKKHGLSGVEAAELIQDYGEVVKDMREKRGYDRIFSYNYRVGVFLSNFLEKRDDSYVHLAQKDRDSRALLEVRSLDGRKISQPVLESVQGGILMSGSLSPTEVYRDLIFKKPDKVKVREFESPFPAENRLILLATDVSSKYDRRNKEMIQRWSRYIEAVLEENEGNVAVFNTSYRLMQRVLGNVNSGREIIAERYNTKRETVLRRLKSSDNCALFGVMGGKLSEGVDYPGNLLTGVVAVGLPFATWDVYQRALINYYEDQYPGKGWLYAYVTPAILRIVQTCGRVHRSANDKGCLVILDQRVAQNHISMLLPEYFQEEIKFINDPFEAGHFIKKFWNRHNNI